MTCDDCKYQYKIFHPDRRMKNGGRYQYWCMLDPDWKTQGTDIPHGQPGKTCHKWDPKEKNNKE